MPRTFSFVNVQPYTLSVSTHLSRVIDHTVCLLADECRYIDCVLDGTSSRDNEVNVYLSNLHMAQNADDVVARCAIMVNRTERCEAEKTNCPTALTNTWDNRMKDPFYIEFLMSLAKDMCSHPDNLFDMKNCVKEDLHKALQECVQSGLHLNVSCLRQQFLKFENCSSTTDALFNHLAFKFLLSNPYRRQGTQSPP